MRILFVHNRYLQSLGGEDTTVAAEMDLLAARGHIVKAQLFNNEHFKGNLFSKIKAGLNTIYNTRSRQIVEQAARDFKPGIIHVHNFFFEASPAVFDAAHALNIPVVLTIQNYRLLCANALLLRDGKVCEDCIHSAFPWKGVACKCYHHSYRDSTMVGLIAAVHKMKDTFNSKVDRIITPSEFMRNKLLHSSLHIQDENKIIVKPNFIEDPGQDAAGQRESYCLFVGRLAEEKGINSLLKCFAGLPGEQLIIAGDGPGEAQWKEAYAGSKNITFAGRQSKEEVWRLLKKCKALIFPSIWYEGLPLSIIEAFATGTPVIGSNLGAMQEMISPGYNGFLFEKDNIEAMQMAIASLNDMVAKNNYLLYKGARETYMNKYHPDICYRQIMQVYEKAITDQKNN